MQSGARTAGGTLQERLAFNVRRLRNDRGWTQDETAWRSRLAVRMYQTIEAGTANPTVATLARLSEAFEANAQELIAPATAPLVRRLGRPRRNAAAAVDLGEPATASSGGNLLIIEADDAMREALDVYLERQGFVVTAAASAAEGLRRLQQGPFDLVLCGDTLPDHPSSWIREHAPAAQHLDRTLLSIGRDGHAAGAAGGQRARPLDIDRLLRAIKGVLRHRSGAHAPRRSLPSESARAQTVELALYVTKTPASRRALRNLEAVLRGYDRTRVCLHVHDLDADPQAGDGADRIVFTPTLVKRAPGERSWLLGDLQDRTALERLLRDAGLERER